MTNLLAFDDVSFAYGGRTVLSRFTADIATGSCIALAGPNGAGKTTLLRLAAGILQPRSGAIELSGRQLASMSRRTIARTVALVPQEVELAFPFTVEQFVQQGRTPYRGWFGSLSSMDRDAVEQALHLTGATHLSNRMFNQLSGGERQRVKIALGLAQSPQILLLDEPTQHLDIGRQLELIDLIQRLSERGLAIVAAMHHLELIEGTFSSVWLLSPGSPVRKGAPEEMLQPELLEAVFELPSNGRVSSRARDWTTKEASCR